VADIADSVFDGLCKNSWQESWVLHNEETLTLTTTISILHIIVLAHSCEMLLASGKKKHDSD